MTEAEAARNGALLDDNEDDFQYEEVEVIE
jgi:hypothetical protein